MIAFEAEMTASVGVRRKFSSENGDAHRAPLQFVLAFYRVSAFRDEQITWFLTKQRNACSRDR